MSWYKRIKTAGVTFSIQGSLDIGQPMMVSRIASELLRFISKLFPDIGSSLGYNDVDIDGLEDSPLGTINIYMRDDVWGKQMIQRIIDGFNQEMAGEIVVRYRTIDQSKMYGVPTIRIDVIKNDTVNREQLPEFHIHQANAYALLKLLQSEGLPVNPDQEMAGQFQIDQLDQVIDKILSNEYMIKSYEQSDENRPQLQSDFSNLNEVFQSGASAGRLKPILLQLKQMIQYIRDNQFPAQVIQFA